MIDQVEFSTDKGVSHPLRNVAPPQFTTTKWPLKYMYQQNSTVVNVLVKENENAVSLFYIKVNSL